MNGKEWTLEKLLKDMAEKFTAEEMAWITGHPVRSVQERLRLLGLKASRTKDWTKRRIER